MHRIKIAALYLASALLIVGGTSTPSHAQMYTVIATCGSVTLDAGFQRGPYQDVNGNACSSSTAPVGGATAANQTSTQANPGSDASKATAVQGVTGGKAVAISAGTLPLPTNAAQETGGNLDAIKTATQAGATAANQTTLNTAVTETHANAGSTPSKAEAVQGIAGGVALPVSGNVTAAQGTAAGVASGWPTINGEPADATGAFTNGTQTGNVTTAGIDGYGTALITITGTYGAATATFLASDDGGTTFYPIACSRTDGSTAPETGYTSLTNVSRAWLCPVQGFDTVRVLSSAVASGTANVRISQTAAPTSAMTQQTINGTVTANAGTNLNTSALATSANQPSAAAQASTTAGQTGTVSMTATTTASPTYVTGQTNPGSTDVHGGTRVLNMDSTGAPIDYTKNLNFNPYPGGAVAVSCSTGNVAAATATCTLPAALGKTTYITGFDITASGATIGSVVTCTLTNTGSGTHSYTFAAAAGVLLSDTPLTKSFPTPLSATATNTAPVLSCPSLGTGNTNMTINADGFEL